MRINWFYSLPKTKKNDRRSSLPIIQVKNSCRYPFLLKLYADGGYQGPEFQAAKKRLLPNLEVSIVKRSDKAKGFAVPPKRWTLGSSPRAERTIEWPNRCRRPPKLARQHARPAPQEPGRAAMRTLT